MMHESAPGLDDHLFRHESGRMVAALTRIFGFHNQALAEDVVQDAFCRALEVWKFHGVPENPSAWLMATAKNRALDVLRRERTARTFAPELGRMAESEWTLAPAVEELFGAHAIKDDELRMMFSCCQPRLPEVAQIALVLNILCGFSVAEVAAAFLVAEPAMAKRIARAKKTLAASKSMFELKNSRDFAKRLSAVRRALYLLFNEGYHGASAQSPIRPELCQEAMRLAALLAAHPLASGPATHALCALMCFHAARLPSRLGADGGLASLFDQDRARWDARLVADGHRLLDLSAAGKEVTPYHVEAMIAATHADAADAERTDWARIVRLYDLLMALQPSPVVALSRAIAIGLLEGPERGLREVAAIEHADRLAQYPFYPAALGEMALRCGRADQAREHFQAALAVARNPTETNFLAARLRACAPDDERSQSA